METSEDSCWQRQGSTLYYTARISLCAALTNTIVEIPTFDGRTLSVPITDIVSPGYTKTVPGEGMPCADGSKGDMVIQFETSFPESLTKEQKAAIKKQLPQ